MPTKDKPADRGPWWVKDSKGAQFATYRMAEGLTDTGEDPFRRDGGLRRTIPADVQQPAKATKKGDSE